VVRSLREREREGAAIRELLDGRGRMLLLEGRAGIGKTSLIELACSQAAGLGFEVLRARGSELEAGFAFGVVRQLFERRLAAAGPGERAALLAGPAAATRPLLAGELAGPPAGDSSFAVLHGLYWLVVNLAAGRPLLLAIDDAQWADEPSLRWLAYLARRLDGLAAGVLVALRPGDPAMLGARPGPGRAQGGRRPAAAPVADRGGRADPERAARGPAGRRRPLQPRDRRRAVRHPQGGRGSPGPRLRQARDRRPRPAGRRPGGSAGRPGKDSGKD
jgi:hypothetical protein